MATHSGVLARRIPWTEELSGLSPWGHKESDTPERLTYPLISQSAAPYLPTLPKTPASRQVGCLSLEQQFLSSFLKLKKPSSNSDRNCELILSNTLPHTHTTPRHTHPHTPPTRSHPPHTSHHTHTHTHTPHTHTLEDPRVRDSPLPPGGKLAICWMDPGFPARRQEAPLGRPGTGHTRAAQTPFSQGAAKGLASSTSLLSSSIRRQTK